MIKISSGIGVKIVAAATYVPREHQFSNLDILRRHPEFKEQPEGRLKIFARRIFEEYGFENRCLIRFPDGPVVPESLTSEDLALKTLKAAAGKCPSWAPEVMVHGTTTTGRYTGSQATALAGSMNWKIPSYETRTGCATSLGALHMINILMLGGVERVALSCSETLSKVINPQYRDDWFGMGDGAASLFLEKSSRPDFRILRSVFFTKGELSELYTTTASLPPNRAGLDAGGYFLHGEPERLRQEAKLGYQEMLDLLVPDANERARIRWIVPHQVNRALINDVKASNKLGGEFLTNSQDIGNIGGSSVLYSFCDAWEKSVFQAGDLVLLMSVGGGLSISGQLWEKCA